ncbi:proteasome assembly chaperone family protein [Halobaculum gomorrense]|uniref:PAC2 family protein n=1 Tax=Halobaculum gomorrense TaxID=43928 RepID=A0A1M5S3Z1_9EURY|nr:PAC2 family protein [Halobaculum gomorrense]SHH33307.1 uncharacterized protein SAMN05443636_2332 [Halobaculum gomorrense]
MSAFAEGTTFHVTTVDEPASAVIAGFSQFGLAGLTAADYLVDHLELEQTGHIRAEGLPTITPFENGRPRYPTRLFSRDDLDVTVLVGELFVPYGLAEPFSRAILGWTEEAAVEEIAVLSGAPFPHGPTEHRAFYVASDDYRELHFPDHDPDAAPVSSAPDSGSPAASGDDEEHGGQPTTAEADAVPDGEPGGARPMTNGFLDGTNAALIARAMESDLGGCVFVTPVHAQVPDVDAAVRLVAAVDHVYDLGVDTAPLEEFAAQVGQYYRTLAERLEAHADEEQPTDRMYM